MVKTSSNRVSSDFGQQQRFVEQVSSCVALIELSSALIIALVSETSSTASSSSFRLSTTALSLMVGIWLDSILPTTLPILDSLRMSTYSLRNTRTPWKLLSYDLDFKL